MIDVNECNKNMWIFYEINVYKRQDTPSMTARLKSDGSDKQTLTIIAINKAFYWSINQISNKLLK